MKQLPTMPDRSGREQLISIIIPFLNAERFIGEAIASVFSQTYRNWELLLVNDGSTDRSPAIAHRYAREHPSKVSYLQHPRQERRGISTSRNVGIAHAKGSYLAFLDADDVWMPNKLEQQLAVLVAEPEAAMIYGASLEWYSWTGRAKDLTRDQFTPVVSGEKSYVDLSMLSVRQDWLTPSPSGILVRRGAVAAVGDFEDVFDSLFEDEAFYFKLGLRSQVLASNECWYKYRQHPDSVSVVERGAHTIAKLKFLQWAVHYLASSNTARSDLREALTQELSAALPQRGPAAMFKTVVKRVTPYAVRRWLRRVL